MREVQPPQTPAGLTASPSATQETVVEPAGFVLTAENLPDIAAAMLAAQTYDTTMVTEVAGASMTAQGQARVSDAGTEMTLSMSSPEMAAPLEIRLVGGQMYINMGGADPGGLFWPLQSPRTPPTP